MLKWKIPEFHELEFRRQLLSDEATMAYNKKWGGTISFPREKWADWYARWVTGDGLVAGSDTGSGSDAGSDAGSGSNAGVDAGPARFYAYLFCEEEGAYVGEIGYHFDEGYGEYIANVIVHSRYRGKGYGKQGLSLLCQKCAADGHEALCDNIAVDNPSIRLFLQAGFREIWREDAFIMLKKELRNMDIESVEVCESERRMLEDIAQIEGLDEEYVKKAWDRWDTLCKPLRSFGVLEENVARMAGIERTIRPVFDKPVIVIMAADNGVVEEGVSQTGCEVTTQVLENMAVYQSAVCILGREIGAEVVPVDLGAKYPPEHPRVLNRCIRRCTGNIAKGPAMSREEAARAVNEGIQVIRTLKEQGYHVVITGEMGIGNTTTSSAMAAVLLDKEVETVTGRGAGLSTEGLNRKIAAIRQAIAINQPDKEDILDVVSKVGGFDIAGLIGCFLGAALCRLPVLIDGFISSVAAYCAVRLCPQAKDYMFATHCSGEPAGRLLLDALGLDPIVMAGMRMGEGTGAVVGYSVMKAGFAIYDNLPSFAETAIEEYHHLS